MENGTSAASVARIERSDSQSRYDYLPSALNLKRQAGRLAEGDLAGIEALLTIDTTPPR